MEVNSEIIRLIKEKFVKQQRAVRSVKQLDFFMKRAKTEGDKFTNLKFNQFLENNDLEVHFDRAVHNLSSLSKADLTVTKNKLSLIQDNNTSPKSHTVLNQVLTMYEKYMDGFDDGDKYQFEKPWLTNIIYSTPKNIKTGLPYRGGNEFLLELIQQERTLDLPIYLNEHNIEEIGETLPSNPIAVCQKVIDVYLNPKLESDHPKKWVSATEYRKLTSIEQDDYVNKKSLKLFNLYHHSQYADSLTSNSKYQKWLSNFRETKLLNKLKSCDSADERKKIFEPKVFAATAFIDLARKQMKIKLKSDPNSCHYTPATDEIAMVDVENFRGEFAELLYAGVYAHENSHATAYYHA